MSQPAISQTLKEIESAFGGELFTRTARGVIANDRLQPLLRRAAIVLGEIAAAERELRGPKIATRVIRIGANLHLLRFLIPSVIERLRAARGAPRFSLTEDSSARLLTALASGQFDCVLARLGDQGTEDSNMKDFAFWPVYRGRQCVVVNSRHPLARRRRISLLDLANEEWALSTTEGRSRDLLANAFLRAGLSPPEPVIECRPFHANLAIALALPVVTIVMRAEAALEQKEGRLRILPVDLNIDAPPIAFVCRKSWADDPLIAEARAAAIAAGRRLDRI
ncbi:MAG TPA: LysR substrate-binding domain-containing protein [Burkholderiales bacterium]|nr:LysR substrate-binding domain-containing protein [Burkholderiales bacterium]